MKETQAAVDSQEFTGWRAYYEVEPWGEERADLRSAVVALTVYNMLRGKKAPTLTLDSFMPNFGERSFPSADELQRKLGAALGVAV